MTNTHSRLELSVVLQEKLKQLRSQQLIRHNDDELLNREEAVVLTYGLGQAIYLTLDGRIIFWDIGAMWSDTDQPVERSEMKDIAGALVIGARGLHLPELIELIPAKPGHATVCQQCTGERIVYLKKEDKKSWIICWVCSGLGWVETSKAPD